MQRILDINAQNMAERDPIYLQAIENSDDPRKFFRHAAYCIVATDSPIVDQLCFNYTGVWHLLATCILLKIRTHFSSSDSTYAGTKRHRDEVGRTSKRLRNG